jgi:hypothetical protein
MVFNRQLNIEYLTSRLKETEEKTYPCDILEMFLAPRQSQESPWYYTRCEPLSEKVLTQSAGKDRKHAFQKEWCNIIERLIYRLENFFLGVGAALYIPDVTKARRAATHVRP